MPPAENAELRLIRLEENTWFMEEKIKSLESQLTEQQHSLDAMGKTVAQLKNMLAELQIQLDTSTLSRLDSAKETPPHYQAAPW